MQKSRGLILVSGTLELFSETDLFHKPEKQSFMLLSPDSMLHDTADKILTTDNYLSRHHFHNHQIEKKKRIHVGVSLYNVCYN